MLAACRGESMLSSCRRLEAERGGSVKVGFGLGLGLGEMVHLDPGSEPSREL